MVQQAAGSGKRGLRGCLLVGVQGVRTQSPYLGQDGAALCFGAGTLGQIGGHQDGRLVFGPQNGDVVGGVFSVRAGLVAGEPTRGEAGAEAVGAGLVGD
jgi:hypothetical protein